MVVLKKTKDNKKDILCPILIGEYKPKQKSIKVRITYKNGSILEVSYPMETLKFASADGKITNFKSIEEFRNSSEIFKQCNNIEIPHFSELFRVQKCISQLKPEEEVKKQKEEAKKQKEEGHNLNTSTEENLNYKRQGYLSEENLKKHNGVQRWIEVGQSSITSSSSSNSSHTSGLLSHSTSSLSLFDSNTSDSDCGSNIGSP